MWIINEEDSDPGFRYEGLVRTAFNNCKKYGDPWGYASQDCYNNFVPKPNLRGKRALSTALVKLIIDNSNNLNIEELKQLEDSIWVSETQGEIIAIIDNTISWLKKYLS